MARPNRVKSWLSTLAPGTSGEDFRKLWAKLRPLPYGKQLFSRALGLLIPYTGSIQFQVEELDPGHAVVLLHDRRAHHNHLGSVHAIALANVAELTGNLALVAAMPETARFIVTSLTLDYTKKARGPVRASCRCPTDIGAERREYELTVTLLDAQGDAVATARLRSLVGPKPAAGEPRVINGSGRATRD